MKTILLHNPAKQDNVEAMADALVESMRYANSAVDYPDISKAKPDDGVPAEWFYKAYVGTAPRRNSRPFSSTRSSGCSSTKLAKRSSVSPSPK